MSIEIDAGTEDGRRIRRHAAWVVASNTRFYGGRFFKVNDRADIADGLFDVCLSRAPNFRRIAVHFYGVATGRHRAMPDFEFFQAKRMTIRTSRPYPYQLDGDAAGMTPLELELVPGALKVIVPRPS
jgi:diacylglycerol kinase family enzyme